MVSSKDWKNFMTKLSKINERAGELMTKYIETNGFEDNQALLAYAYSIVTKYGETSSAFACMLYDEIAALEGVAPAVPALTPTFAETAKAVNGSLLQSPSGQLVSSTVSRLVKQAGQDTLLQNAQRDGAEWAWIPAGDTCAFCITLASRGWQRQSRRSAQRHAEHIHANCDCSYCVRFGSKGGVEGYDPNEYLAEYDAQRGKPVDRINAMRRERYAENKDEINRQKREAYAKRKQLEQSEE